MATVLLFKSQDPPRIPEPQSKPAETAGSFLGDYRIQGIGTAGLRPELRPDLRRGVVLGIRALARAAEARNAAAAEAEVTRREFRWLAENQHAYAGRWVALQGDNLLAVGDSAREVYAAIADHRGRIPLVAKVEPAEDVYFAGW